MKNKKRHSAQLESDNNVCLCPVSRAVPHIPDTKAPSGDYVGMVTSAEKGYGEVKQYPPK